MVLRREARVDSIFATRTYRETVRVQTYPRKDVLQISRTISVEVKSRSETLSEVANDFFVAQNGTDVGDERIVLH